MITKKRIANAIGVSLRDFGYPDASDAKMVEIIDAYLGGKRGNDLPHGVLGGFAERQLQDMEATAEKSLAEILA